MSEPLEWQADGEPYSPRFADIYRSSGTGLAQSREVFLRGCGLPQGWARMPAYRILETGFGLGLNFLTSWATWEADPNHCEMLHFVSVEAYPVAAQDLLRSALALQATDDAGAALLPQVQSRAAELADAWRTLRPGLQTLPFAQGRIHLTLAVGEVLPMLALLAEPVDAVFLDGFSPARNPEIWSESTLGAVARLCRPGTRLASWCVAGDVRLRLQQAGFDVYKRAGLPPKRHRLEAHKCGAANGGSSASAQAWPAPRTRNSGSQTRG